MFLGMKRRNWIFFALGLIIALGTKEDVVVALGVFGFVLMVFDYFQYKKLAKIPVIIFCAAILTYGFGIVFSRLIFRRHASQMLSYLSIRYAYIGQPLSVLFHWSSDVIFLEFSVSDSRLFLTAGLFAAFSAKMGISCGSRSCSLVFFPLITRSMGSCCNIPRPLSPSFSWLLLKCCQKIAGTRKYNRL